MRLSESAAPLLENVAAKKAAGSNRVITLATEGVSATAGGDDKMQGLTPL